MPEYCEIEWTEIARDDLDEITDFIALDSIEIAIKIYNRLIQKVESLSKFPARGRIVPELKEFGFDLYREIIVRPYRIFYKIENDSKVIILGILDGRRDLLQVLLQRIVF
ncbi:MAG: type II toxin-antitoxin system RelE/ParE family toxin [bacterium]|nr:MAG: type II toxin-antitoxin system RelE/ParE family toxin [bacterium]